MNEELKSLSNVEVLYRIRWAVERKDAGLNAGNEKAELEALEDFQLALEEALRRMK